MIEFQYQIAYDILSIFESRNLIIIYIYIYSTRDLSLNSGSGLYLYIKLIRYFG